MNTIHVGELKVGKIVDVRNSDIYVQLNNSEQQVLIKRENNYLLEDELLYEYLLQSNLITPQFFNKLVKKKKKRENVRGDNEHYANGKKENEVEDCIVLIKEINDNNEICGELYTNEIIKRKVKIYEKLNELKSLEKKIFIKILKNVKNKYYIVLINDCIKGYLLYDEIKEIEERKNKNTNTIASDRLSAYIVDVNKKLEYVFLSMQKYTPTILANRLLDVQNNIVLENIFENKYFKGEIVDFSNNGNNVIVKIFENTKGSIKVKIKSHNIINVKNMLRNFDYLKNKVITHYFTKCVERERNQSNLLEKTETMKLKRNETGEYAHYDNPLNEKTEEIKELLENKESEERKSKMKKEKYMHEQFAKFKENYYGCKEADAVKYINMDGYIYKEENCIYVRIINKTLEKNLYEGSMIKPEVYINQNIFDIWKQMSNVSNEIQNYDNKLRYPSTVLGFFNNYVLLRTNVLHALNPLEKEGNCEKEDQSNKNFSENNNNSCESATINNGKEGNKVKEVFTLIEKCHIDHENLKEGDVFFCRFEKTKNQNIRNLFNLSNETLKNIYEQFFKQDIRKDGLSYKIEKKIKMSPKNSFKEIFLKKKKIYIMRGELHKETEYRLNKNNIDQTYKKLKNICDTYYTGFNTSYDHYSSIREAFILKYLGKYNYKLYRKIVGDYFSSNKNSYKEFLGVGCESLTSTIFDIVFEDPKRITKELIQTYNKDLWEKVKRLNIFELNCLLKDLLELKNELNTYSFDYNSKIGRMNLLLNNQKPINKEIIHSLKLSEDDAINNDIKKELLRVYRSSFIYPISYVKELLMKKKDAKCGGDEKLKTVYILAEETINLYENSAKDVQPFSEVEIEQIKKHIISRRKGDNMGMRSGNVSGEENNKDIKINLFDASNSQLRKVLYMIKDDLEKQKKKNKLEEVDRIYEEEQKHYTDITDIHKNLYELKEMSNLSEDMFHLKIPFIE